MVGAKKLNLLEFRLMAKSIILMICMKLGLVETFSITIKQ